MSELGAYVIAAGGTGGHILPGIALADEIRAQKSGASVVFVGTANGLETKIVPAAGYPLEFVDASGFLRRAATVRWIGEATWSPSIPGSPMSRRT